MVLVCLPSDALSQYLPSYLGFSYLGQGVSPHHSPYWPWTWSSSSRPFCARTATTPWTWGCSSQPLPQKTPKKDGLLIIGDWNAKVGSQETPGVKGKFGLGIQNEAEQMLIEFCQENTLVIANTLCQQHKRRLHMEITRWSTPKSDWLYYLQPKLQKLYTVSKNKTRSWLWLRPWNPYCQIQT